MDEQRHGEVCSLAPPLDLGAQLLALRDAHPRARVYRGPQCRSPDGWLLHLHRHEGRLLSQPASRIDGGNLWLICLLHHGYADFPAEFVAVWESGE